MYDMNCKSCVQEVVLRLWTLGCIEILRVPCGHLLQEIFQSIDRIINYIAGVYKVPILSFQRLVLISEAEQDN